MIQKGRLKILLGYAAGVGKTYSMLEDAHEKLRSGVDVVAGYVDPNTSPETMQLLQGLEILPLKTFRNGNYPIKEFDLDAALERKPELILVDELAHTNALGMRNRKRCQDIEELLNAGIDVYTTMNIQDLESLNDIIRKITTLDITETVPDSVFDDADAVETIDLAPDELLKRFEEGKIYRPARSYNLMKFIFTKENLRLLREITMRKAADRISDDNQSEQFIKDRVISPKFLVYVSASASSANSIRWAARATEAFHAPWVAVYVDKMGHDNEAEVQENLDLAKRLGADTVRLNGHDIAATIAEYAKITGISNIVIGKVRDKKPVTRLFEKTLEDRLIAKLPSVEIHIIPESPQARYRKQRRIKISENLILSWPDVLKTVGLLAAATLLSMGLRSVDIDDQNVIMLYILSVLIISRITEGYLYGMAASVLSVLLFNFFFTLPYYTFNAIQPGYPVTFSIMLLAAFITSTLTIRIKSQVRLSVEREHRTKLLYEINKKLLQTRGLDNIVKMTNEYITKIFDRSVVFYTEDPENPSAGYFMESTTDPYSNVLRNEEERAVAHWAYVNKKRAGAGTDTLVNSGAYYTPIISQGKVLGVIGISCAKGKLDQDNRLFLRMLASQVAMALERQDLSDEQRKIIVESEKEKMRSNLLRAISHDIRTPLTGILGASSAILENGDRLDRDTHDKLVSNIKKDSQWLIHLVENLLSVTRINEGTMNVTKSMEAAEEVIAEAVSRIRKRFPESKISVKVPDELLMVPMDGTLIEQVLINLLENAIKHSAADSPVEVEAKSEQGYALFEVRDHGKGIAAEDFPYLFEGYAPNENRSPDSSRGMGIGLSICKSIIKAHGGSLNVTNGKEDGAVFFFSLPLEGVKNE